MTYRIAIRPTDEGFSACCPDLPGCWSQGATEREARENLAEAIGEYLVVRDELSIGDRLKHTGPSP